MRVVVGICSAVVVLFPELQAVESMCWSQLCVIIPLVASLVARVNFRNSGDMVGSRAAEVIGEMIGSRLLDLVSVIIVVEDIVELERPSQAYGLATAVAGTLKFVV